MVRHHVICLVLALCAGADAPDAPPIPFKQYEASMANLEPGDLVFRVGRGWRADAVRSASRSRFSHVGMLYEKGHDDRWTVLHAAPPESADPGGVRVETLDDFSAPSQAAAIAFAKANLPQAPDRERVIRAMHSLSDERKPFDTDFDLNAADKIYCSELVAIAYQEAGYSIVDRSRNEIGTLLGIDMLFPSDLVETGLFEFTDN